MADSILNLKKVADNGLLSKIQIGGQTYELKDLIARENIDTLRGLLNELSGNHTADIERIDAAIKAIQEGAYDDTALRALITELQNNKADKEQVAKDIAAAVAAEAEIARAAEKANADEIARVDAALKLAIDDEDGKGLNSIKDLATWIEEHGEDAAEMSAAITKNAEDIAAMDEAYKAADAGLSGRIDALEGKFTGEGSVDSLIAVAMQGAIDAAAKDASDKDAVVTKAFQDADKAIVDSLGELAYKDNATGTVAGQTISGVKANGQSAGSITVELEQSEHAMNSTGKYTPAGNVTGTVKTAGAVAVTAKYDAADAVLSKGDYTPAGTVSADFSHASANATLTKGDYTPAGSVAVTLSGASFNAITGVGTQASFQEGAYHAATLSYDNVEKNVAKEGLVGSVTDECLTFTAAGLEAISASKVTAFNGGSKDADTFVANSLPTMAEQNVGVQSATFTGTKATELVVTGVAYDKASLANLTFTGTKAENALVTGVSYQKADIDTATFTGETVDISAKFAGTEGDVAVAGLCHDYSVKTAQFNPAAIEVTVGDIVVAEKNVTVQ